MKNLFRLLPYFGTVIAFALPALSDPTYGLFMVVKGSVKVQSGTGATVDAKVGSKILEGDTVISGADSRAKIVMSDRNTFNINPDTKLSIQKYANDVNSGQKNVQLNLLEGKVRSNVEQSYDGAKSTFQIKTPTAVAGVRGTQFVAAYEPASGISSVVTFKGAVTFASLDVGGKIVGKPVLVVKGHTSESAPNQPAKLPVLVPKDTIKKMEGESTVSLKNTTNSTSSVSSTSATGQPGPASVGSVGSVGPATPTSGTSAMLDSRDLDVGLAKGITATSAASTPPPPMGLLGTPPPPPPTNTLVQGVLNNTAAKTTLVVTPSPH